MNNKAQTPAWIEPESGSSTTHECTAHIADECRVFVVTLFDGTLRHQWMGHRDATRLRKKANVFCDEVTGRLTLHSRDLSNRTEVHAVAQGSRLMLWLALTSIGRRVDQHEIATLLGIPERSRPESKQCCVYEQVSRFKKFLGGTLGRRMLQTDRRGGYEILSVGWSFCWIRRLRDSKRSVLRGASRN